MSPEATQEAKAPSRVSPTQAIQGLQGQINYLGQIMQHLARQVNEIHLVTFRANEETVATLRAEAEAAQAAEEEASTEEE